MRTIIKNKAELSTTKLRKDALDIIESGITAVSPDILMKSQIKYDFENDSIIIKGRHISLSKGRIFVIGGGKAVGRMAEVLEEIIPPEKITAGIVNCNSDGFETRKIQVIKAGHPIPDQRGVNGVLLMLNLKQEISIGESDLILCLLSGGGSALMPYPVSGLGLKDIQITTELLLESGANIKEINAVRKHLSQVKGGRLGAYFAPAMVVSIIISDVIGNEMDAIASGPTSPDGTSFEDALNILKKYRLMKRVPKGVRDYIENNMGNDENETPKELKNCINIIIGDNEIALTAMGKRASELGYKSKTISKELSGNPANAAIKIAKKILNDNYSGLDTLLIGGETTPVIPNRHGRGGRNQHYVLVSLLEMSGYDGSWALAAVSTDGSDFLAEVAGAIVDNESFEIFQRKGLDLNSYIKNYDSNTFLNELGQSLIITGNTNTNVGDLIVYILD